MALRLMSHWCPDCDHWAFECRCELRAEEARKELAYRREEIIGRGRAHPIRRGHVLICHMLDRLGR